MSWGGMWAPYVSVGKKLANAKKHVAQLAKKQGRLPQPVTDVGRKIAKTFWGSAWCENLEAYSDFSNRLPRGATYVRNGSVVDLLIESGKIKAIVAGSETYKIEITITSLPKPIWIKIKQDCSASIDSLLDLLAGRFSDGVMKRLTQPMEGLFPSPKEIKMSCSCPDYSYCCKHLAAVMYGVGNRLDTRPELLFLLREVDHQELVTQAVADGNLDRELAGTTDDSLAGQDLGALFGIELDTAAAAAPAKQSKGTGRGKSKVKVPGKKKVSQKKTPVKTLKAPASVAKVKKVAAQAQNTATKSAKTRAETKANSANRGTPKRPM